MDDCYKKVGLAFPSSLEVGAKILCSPDDATKAGLTASRACIKAGLEAAHIDIVAEMAEVKKVGAGACDFKSPLFIYRLVN